MIGAVHLLLVCLSASFAAENVTAPSAAAPSPAPLPDVRLRVESKQSHRGSTRGGASVSSRSEARGGASERLRLTDLDLSLEKVARAETRAVTRSTSSGAGAYDQFADTRGDANSIGARKATSSTHSISFGNTTGGAYTGVVTGANARFSGELNATTSQEGGAIRRSKRTDEAANIVQSGASKNKGFFTFRNLADSEVKRSAEAGPAPSRERETVASRAVQTGHSEGSAVVFTNGTAANLASSTEDSPGSRRDLVGRSNVAGNASSIGHGFFRHSVESDSELAANRTALRALAVTSGDGETRRRAILHQSADSGGAGRHAGRTSSTPGADSTISERMSVAEARQSHLASSRGQGNFSVSSEAQMVTEVQKPNA
ncbi:hypothetical protein FJT64_020618 [Amphibalanus amphitrite]|uniref:Uncharacterized protein n=1 Tax=Amphibalanus amphitrite TaxID=1232801 RepID=A0A6A4WWT6_AMPAM|nr:uncharacterized protein LOC122363835 [Amphibalanus amphitrite]XP_043218084.1 uncharacterized protein LOC122379739 [Amphibalanus amphitrite]KAF0308140.1 hypothetical protein FJT64_020618 [Amphibalanus amphitrite]